MKETNNAILLARHVDSPWSFDGEATASPPKAKWNMAQGYDDFFNEEDDESDDRPPEIEDELRSKRESTHDSSCA